MTPDTSEELARKAKLVYQIQLKESLEQHHRNKYVAIEPESCEYFLGTSYTEAIQSARQCYPDRIPFVIRVGHDCAVEVGSIFP